MTQGFKLEVGGTYADADGEVHICTAYDSEDDSFICSSEETGGGYYFPSGQLKIAETPEEAESEQPRVTLRPIA